MITQSELLSKAPEGATQYYKHASNYNDMYYRFDMSWKYYHCGKWIPSLNTNAWIKENLLPIPIPQQIKENWLENGELPPVGVECELFLDKS